MLVATLLSVIPAVNRIHVKITNTKCLQRLYCCQSSMSPLLAKVKTIIGGDSDSGDSDHSVMIVHYKDH